MFFHTSWQLLNNISCIVDPTTSTPLIRNKETNIGYYLHNTTRQFKCEAYGYPLPSIEWNYSDNFNELISNSTRNINTSAISMTEVISTIQLIIGPSDNLSCKACNDLGCYTSIIKTIFTLDVPHGFGMEKPISNVAVGDVFKLTCYASIYRHTNNIRWFNGSKHITNSGRIHIQPTIIKNHSYVSELSIYNINLQDANYYTCQGESKDGFRKLDICELTAFGNLIINNCDKH
ncbi:uncharacterized protein LOC141525481 [Cotesia typhae]|uniref:uncharacterized protein LOC141525481 n=1 Tax=Cotesia typhae TaxID=2053667 RepID=UPI003D69DF13